MNLEHVATFHPVGQGLFYSAEVLLNSRRMLRYVFDCGSESRRAHLDSALEEFFGTKTRATFEAIEGDPRRMDLVVLSHLHRDHLNGLPRLLGGNRSPRFDVDLVVLPYLYPYERIVLAAEESARRPLPRWYAEFLRDPVGYLRSRGAADVVLLRGGGGGDAPDLNEPTAPPGDQPPDGHESMDRVTHGLVKADARAQEECARQEAEMRGIPTPEVVCTTKGAIRRSSWVFEFFNKAWGLDRVADLHAALLPIIEDRPLAKVLADRGLLSKVQGAYRAAFGDHGMNATSVAMLSRPEACDPSGLTVELLSPIAARLSLVKEDAAFMLMGAPGFQAATLLTGDLPVPYLWPEVEGKFGLQLGPDGIQLATFQVPHHGAPDGWNLKQVGPTTAVLAISAGLKNRHGHPNRAVLRDITSRGMPLLWSHERAGASIRCSWTAGP